MGLQILGQTRTTASNASFLTGMASVLTPVAAYLADAASSRPSRTASESLWREAGFVLMTFPAAGVAINRGDLLVFGCGVVFAFYIVVLAERSRPPRQRSWLTVIQLATVVPRRGLVAALRPRRVGRDAAGIAPILCEPGPARAGPLPRRRSATAGTFFFQTWAQQHMSATHAAIIFTLEPVFTAILAAWILSERLGPRGWTGGVLVLAGIVVSELRLRPDR